MRLNGTARATGYGYSLFEFQVRLGDGATPRTTEPAAARRPRPLLSYSKPATASSSQNDGQCSNCPPAKALDFDPASRWATPSAGPTRAGSPSTSAPPRT